MLRHITVAPERAWNSWSDRPGEMVFLPLGLRVTPILYSSRLRRCSRMEPRHDVVRLGHHALDGSRIAWESDLADTTVAFSTTKPHPYAFRGSWTARPSEWGLRFWITLALHAEGGEEARLIDGAAVLRFGDRHVALVTDPAPVQVTGHASLDALCADYETHGYFHRDSRAEAAPVLALRFNLEMMPTAAYAAAVADDPALAIAEARAALAAAAAAPEPEDDAYAAIRDIVGWNTIWDADNARPYTAVTRIWNLGRWAVWHNDQTYAALLAGLIDTPLARENMAVALSHAAPQGNFACIATSSDTWVDRSQPPLASLITWNLFQRSGDRALLDQLYPTLARNHRWWRRMRDPGQSGLVSCGTSDVGAALYKGTAFGARNESGMDNSATHDEASYDPATRTLSTWDLGLNCVLALDAEMLARIAATLGHAEDAADFAALAQAHRARIGRDLWDDDRKIFANRQRGDGFVRALSPTSFYPLLCGAADATQTAHLLRHLADPATFAGDWVLPNATRDDPAFADNVYWRGRIWPNVNFLVWLGLRRAGQDKAAEALADRSSDLFFRNWTGTRIAAENYNATTGEAMDQGDTDPFYIWAGLLPLMDMARTVDIDPWRGLCLQPGRDRRIGPLVTPWGKMTVASTTDSLTVTLNGHPVLTLEGGGLDNVTLAADHIAARATVETRLHIHRAAPAFALCDNQPIRIAEESGTHSLTLTPGQQLDLWYR